MAPSPALQARIQQFETLDNLRSARLGGSNYPPVRSISAEQPTLTGSSQSSLIDEPLSPTVASYSIIQPSVPYVTRKQKRKSPSPSPPKLGLKTSLIDLKDWVLEDGPESRQRSAKIAANAASVSAMHQKLRLLISRANQEFVYDIAIIEACHSTAIAASKDFADFE